MFSSNATAWVVTKKNIVIGKQKQCLSLYIDGSLSNPLGCGLWVGVLFLALHGLLNFLYTPLLISIIIFHTIHNKKHATNFFFFF